MKDLNKVLESIYNYNLAFLGSKIENCKIFVSQDVSEILNGVTHYKGLKIITDLILPERTVIIE